jgi:pimeloyl-ACP methyl ester carboxylesterase
VNAEDGNPGSLKQSSVLLAAGESKAIVIGFLGGFVRRDDAHHPEVQLMRALHREYPTGVYFALFENGKVDEAHRAILQQLNVDNSSPPVRDRRPVRIILFGHSWGAAAVVRLSRKLDRDGIPVALTIQVDSVAKPFSNDRLIPANVLEAANFYQTHGLIHGRSSITAADPTHTRIIGNFRREYKTEPEPCRTFPWYSRFFTRGHIEIECDPKLWFEVETLLRRCLSVESIIHRQSDTLNAQAQPTTAD